MSEVEGRIEGKTEREMEWRSEGGYGYRGGLINQEGKRSVADRMNLIAVAYGGRSAF